MIVCAARTSLVALALGGLWSTAAVAAMDPTAAANAIAEAAGAVPGVTFSFGAAVLEGDAVSISGVTLATGDGTTVTVPAIVFTGAEPREEGGFTAARMTFDGGSAVDAQGSAAWTSGAIDDVIVPSKEEVAARAKVLPFATLALSGVTLESPTLAAPLAVETVDLALGEVIDGVPSRLAFHAGGVKLPATLLANSIAGVMAQMMGYQEFVADVAVDGAYDTGAHVDSLDDLAVDIATVGKLTVTADASSFSIGGLTDPNEEISKQARADARLETLTVRFDNAGVVERFLDMQAKMLGATREDVTKQLVEGALPFALSFVKNVPFREAFLAEASDFLHDPRSFTLIAEPPEPLPLGQVVRALTRAPNTVPDLLAPRVEANADVATPNP